MYAADCSVCERPLGIVRPHATRYGHGEVSAICENCWRITTPRERLRCYRRLWLKQYGTTVLHREWWALRRTVLRGG